MFAGWEGDSRLARMGKMNRNPQPAFFLFLYYNLIRRTGKIRRNPSLRGRKKLLPQSAFFVYINFYGIIILRAGKKRKS